MFKKFNTCFKKNVFLFLICLLGMNSSSFGITEDIIDGINNVRANYGMSALTANKKLNKAAQGHSNNMANHNCLSHTLGNSDMTQRIKNAGYNYRSCAENIAYTYHTDAEEVVNMWVNSQGHFDNILGNYRHIGVGVTRRGSTVFYTTVFGRA